jgi:hypothetical protein
MRTQWIVLIFMLTFKAGANDGASSWAAGSIEFKKEPNISMEKEVLEISPLQIKVSYEFKNLSKKPITLEVAFPIPAYEPTDAGPNPQTRPRFSDFTAVVDGHPVKLRETVKAFLGAHYRNNQKEKTTWFEQVFKTKDASDADKDFYPLLKSLKVDVDNPRPDEKMRKKLRNHHLYECEKDDDEIVGSTSSSDWYSTWKVERTFHWKQTFPPNKIVKIIHTYTPQNGIEQYDFERNPPPTKPDMNFQHGYRSQQKNYCIDEGTHNAIVKKEPDHTAMLYPVDYILTSAKTWEGPIKDFLLILKRPTEDYFISLCWAGELKKVSQNTFESHLYNFTPNKDLSIAFIEVGDKHWLYNQQQKRKSN